jgi:transcriptional regulator with XRE-family HTH domain
MENENLSDLPLVTQRLNEIIDTKHLSKADLARITGVSRASVNGWFKRGSISKEAAAKLAGHTGVSIAWILGEQEEVHSQYSEDERKLVDIYRELPSVERANMLAVFEMRLNELKKFYGKFFDSNK